MEGQQAEFSALWARYHLVQVGVTLLDASVDRTPACAGYHEALGLDPMVGAVELSERRFVARWLIRAYCIHHVPVDLLARDASRNLRGNPFQDLS